MIVTQVPGSSNGYHLENGVRTDMSGSYDFAISVSDWKDKVRKSKRASNGWRPPLPWHHTRYIRSDPTGESTGANYFFPDPPVNSFTGDLPGAFFYEGETLPSVPSYITDGALNQALANLSQNQIGLGEDFATRQETADMIADRAKNIGRSARTFADSHPRDWGNVKKWQRGFRRTAHNIPLRWLEVQYGWVPALLDVTEAFDTMKRVDKDGAPERIFVKGVRRESKSVLRKYHPYFASDGPYGDIYGVKCTTRVDDVVGCFVRLDYEMVNPILASLQQLGLANPAALAWELLPYSFVVDWFLPVGQYLNAWTGDLGYRFLGGSQSVFRSRKARVVDSAFPNDLYNRGYAYCTPGRVENFSLAREVFNTSPAPRMPHFKNPLSLGHFANAMALLVSAFR